MKDTPSTAYDRPLSGAESWLDAGRARLAVSGQDQVAAAAMDRAAVIGAGTMGRDIAAALALTGQKVTLIDPSAEARAAAAERIQQIFDKANAPAGLPRITASKEALGTADLIIEAVPEIPALKRDVLADAGTEPGITMVDLTLEQVAESRRRIPSLQHDRAY